MKRFFVVLGSLLMLPAFAEVAPVYYDEVAEYTDEVIDAVDGDEMAKEDAVSKPAVAQRATTNRNTSRASTATRSGTSTRATAAAIRNAQRTANRGTISRTARTVTTQPTTSRSTASRTSVVSRSGNTASPAVRARVGFKQTGGMMPAMKSSSSSTSSSGVTMLSGSGSTSALYTPTTDSSRIGVSQRRASTPVVRISTATTPIVTKDDVSTATSGMEAIAELTEYCQAQYAACMDNYCNVLDDNQGRCTCSKNIKNYQKVEDALAEASEEFQDAVQKIKYLGLTGEQVNSLFEETEAELALKDNGDDKSAIRTSLDRIKDRIVIDAKSSKSSSSSAAGLTGVSMDISGLLDFDLTTAFDLGSFLNNGTKTNDTSSISNQRGEHLYKSAAARCKTSVLNSCTAQGIDAAVITNAYDLEIDKHCIAYERALNDANAEMRTNVRNASIILQQARLMLAQNKNSYGFRDCVAAIDSCMQDEYVCGSDYELCLDPTGKYIANSEVIKGSFPGSPGGVPKNDTPRDEENNDGWTSQGLRGLYAAWNYGGTGTSTKSAFGGGDEENLGAFVDEKLNDWEDDFQETNLTPTDMATYLLQKIGYIDKDNKVHGMCASVMKQCQDYTYSTSSNRSTHNYLPNNEVVRQYLLTTLYKIKNQQDEVLADYAEDCRSDVQSCLSTNGYDEDNATLSVSRSAINACRTEIQTCMSVSGYQATDTSVLSFSAMQDWVNTLLVKCPENYYFKETVTNNTFTSTCVQCSQVRVYSPDGSQTSNYWPTESAGGQVTRCTCSGDNHTDMINTNMSDLEHYGELIGCMEQATN